MADTITGNTPPATTAECGRWILMSDGATWTCDPAAWHPTQSGPDWARVGSVALLLAGLAGGLAFYYKKNLPGYLAANAAALGGMWWLNSTMPNSSLAVPGIVTAAAGAGLALDYARPGGIRSWGKRR